ncbi:uncharacterized protein N7459_000151 [Penicillium hispanicum]|uniref:uncharacterized protein n=1 Tax=Penicillium hispanicum TaxID=1080232 RepID=UPI00253FAE12|nr:uncharacterized protein N7459_000151 [Penicillium hispanicum]KAJ5593943.1 hypothetical protein N7459_000151 [Penicillium hispanicum]
MFHDTGGLWLSWLPALVRRRWLKSITRDWTRYVRLKRDLEQYLDTDLVCQILHDLANVYSVGVDHEPQTLGVPVLDALLEVFMQKTLSQSKDPGHQHRLENDRAVDEEMLFRGDDAELDMVLPAESLPVTNVDLPSNVLFADSASRSKRPNPVIEISSSLSGAGKSQLMYYLVALAILPGFYDKIPIGGQGAAVVLIDADDRFDAWRLHSVAADIIRRAKVALDSDVLNEDTGGSADEELEATVSFALKHVHVFRPQSSSALLSTLQNLDHYLYDISRHHSAARPLQLLAIDSATAFLWQDRLRDEIARTEEIGRSHAEIIQEREQGKSFYLSDLYAELVKELKRLQGRFGCTVVFTTTVSVGRPANSASGQPGPFGPYDQPLSRTPSLRPALPAPWGTFPTLRLVVHRDVVRSFPPTMSAHDARHDAPMRQSVVRQGKFSAWVNAWGREEWPRRVVDGVDWHNGGSFSFYVRESGVEIPLPDGQ